MREELKRAKKSEYEANISKKELVAELSHDIKTPIATIKAICELLDAKWRNRKKETNLIPDEEKEKINIIYHKADIVDKLISNMFQATLEELEMLKVEPLEVESSVLKEMFAQNNYDAKICLINEIPVCLISCDKLRLSQVFDNVITNSCKYAGTEIDVSFQLDPEHKILKIKLKDYGKGVEETELPLVCQKFFRGSGEKVKNASGTGLGLYLSKLFMEQMHGTFEYYNEQGFVVEIGIIIV